MASTRNPDSFSPTFDLFPACSVLSFPLSDWSLLLVGSLDYSPMLLTDFMAYAATYWSVEDGQEMSRFSENLTVSLALQSIAKPGCELTLVSLLPFSSLQMTLQKCSGCISRMMLVLHSLVHPETALLFPAEHVN